MAAKSHTARLEHMIEAMGHLREIVSRLDQSALENDWHWKWLLERGLLIVSEASRHLPDDLKARHPSTPWREIAGIGNVIRHNYDGVSGDILLKIVRDDLQPLEQVCKAELQREQRRELIRQDAVAAARDVRDNDLERGD